MFGKNTLVSGNKVHFNINPIKRSIWNQVFGKSKVLSSILTRIVHISRNNDSIQFGTDCSLLEFDHYL